MTMPAPGIGKRHAHSRPIRKFLRAFHILGDSLCNSDHNSRLKLPQDFAEPRLAGNSRFPASPVAQSIDRPAAKIDKITAKFPERLEERLVSNRRKGLNERISNRSVETRIRPVEKSPGSRGTLSNEQDSNTFGSVTHPQTLFSV